MVVYNSVQYQLLMQNKALEDLSFQTLFQMAEEKYESLQYEEAEHFYNLAYHKNPHDEMLVLCFCNLLKTTQKEDEAKKILQRSIKQMPTGTYKRYFELAEIYQGVKSIKTFQKGIEEAYKCLSNPFKSTAPEPQIKRDIAQAYAGIAEVCLTDLFNEKQAEAKCKEAMQKGITADKTCIDVKLQIANYLMWTDDFDRAKAELLEIYTWIKEGREEYENQAVTTAGKYLLEVEQYQKSLQLFQKLHEDMSSQLQIIYMLLYCSFKLNRLVDCEQYLQEYEQAKQNGEIVNEQIEEAVAEVKVELAKKKKEQEETGEGEEDQWMDVEDQEY